MTPSHLTPVLKKNKPTFELNKAKDIEINDIITTINGNELIVSKETVEDNGIYTVVVLEGDYIVVNDIIASPFEVSHVLPNLYYKLHKLVYNINPQILESTQFKKFNENNIQLFDNIKGLIKI